MKKNIIFHIPWKIKPERISASQIRPLNMLNAFKNSGYNVDVVMGTFEEKKSYILKIKENIKKGKKYIFCYSESSTAPTFLANGWREAIRKGNNDFMFFRYLSTKNIPIGLFYRDIYWKFDLFMKELPYIKKILFPFLYKFDLYMYGKYINTLFLPSVKMKNFIPEFNGSTEALPPGCFISYYSRSDIKNISGINLVYVGGIIGHYNLNELMNYALVKSADINITICVRKEEWETLQKYQKLERDKKITIKHISGDKLDYIYRDADIGLLFIEPILYWAFAMPFKLFEYIGHGIPVISTEDTAVAEFVTEHDIGWVIPNSAFEMSKLISMIHADPSLLYLKKENVLRLRETQTWEARVKHVEETLLSLNN